MNALAQTMILAMLPGLRLQAHAALDEGFDRLEAQLSHSGDPAPSPSPKRKGK